MEVKCDMVTVAELCYYKKKSARTDKLQLCSKQTCTVRNSHNTMYYLPDLYFYVSRYTLMPDKIDFIPCTSQASKIKTPVLITSTWLLFSKIQIIILFKLSDHSVRSGNLQTP